MADTFRPSKSTYLPLHRYVGSGFTLQDFTLMFYEAWSRDDEEEMDHLSMAIEEIKASTPPL
jgi:hypothetical protein